MEKREVSIGEKPVIEMDVVDGKVRLTWETSLLKKTLDHEISKCVGCSLCLPCPWDAITLGPVQETASGRIEGAPLVNVDPEACTFCGLCDSACIFRAFDAQYEGEDAINEYNRIDGTHKIDEEKCAPCVLCEKVCPTGSLRADVKVDRKEKCVTYQGEESASGTIKIDEDKCSQCGLCEILCPEAIKIFWSDTVEPPKFRPAVAIRVNEENCDYCGLCADICPDEAIEVTCKESSKRTIRQPEISGTLTHEDSTCVKCGLCAEVCPFDALEVEKPFKGEVRIVQLDKCDPTGCHNCFNICPTKAIYPTGTAEKIDILDEACVYCGACEHSCPYDVLEVHREGYIVEELDRAREWERARKVFFDAVIGKGPPIPNVFERNIVVKHVERPQVKSSEVSGWDSSDEERKHAMTAIERIRDIMRENPRTHLQLERGLTRKVIEKVTNQEEQKDE
ncbi:MAG: 4Fe-4S binding protein [Candidatus Thorarchaeota archaeon]